ncbi:transcriptional regulator [Streptomyces sp. NBC_01092]|uniref:transcriptional regulator n=1 Tax=Streptomyces sp. NBC_01092 TaxID=2903748 RepID=UPI00386D43D0|nr:winged helix-turn-helix domain-containing protein [Streptomyces sp. NBC_01092]
MLAERLGQSSGATSYHLRQLAAHGFVEDDPERGKGRERWWKAVEQGISVQEDLHQSSDPTVRGAADMLLHEMISQHTRDVTTWVATRDTWGPAWWENHAMDLSDWELRLTPELARELIAKVHELIGKYDDLDVPENAPEAEYVRFHTHVFPIATDRKRPQ